MAGGFGLGLAGLGAAMPSIVNTQIGQQQLAQMQRDQQAQALAAKLLLAARGGNQVTPAVPSMTQLPGATVTPVDGAGISPAVGAANAGGVIPTQPLPGAGMPSPLPNGVGGGSGGLTSLQDIVSALGNVGGSAPDDVKFGAVKNAMGVVNPSEQLMMRYMLGQMNNDTRRYGIDANVDSRNYATDSRAASAAAAETGRNTRAQSALDARMKSLDSVQLQQKFKSLTSTLNSMRASLKPTDKKTAASVQAEWDAALKELNQRRSSAGLPAHPATPSATGGATVPPGAVALPPEGAGVKDGTEVPDETGKIWIKQGNYLVPKG